MLAPLLRQAEARHAQLLEAAPSELHPALSAGFAPTADALAEKAAAIDALTADRRRAMALEQSVQLAEALLRQDPEQYEILVADAGAMADGLGLDPEAHRTLMGRVRERLAGATLLAELDPAAGDPAEAEQDLQRGRFRDAFDEAGIEAWRDLVAANQARRQARDALATRDTGIVAEIKMLNRLAAAGRGEAPMSAPAEVETMFPGESATRLAAAARDRQRSVYAAEIAAQPFDRDPAWIEAATSEADHAIRTEAVQQKHREFARSGGGSLLKQYPALGAAVAAGVEDPAKLEDAIALYQRQLQKLGVPPRERELLPTEALAALAGQYHAAATPAARVDWLDRLASGAGEERAHAVLRTLGSLPNGVPAAAQRALRALSRPHGYGIAEHIIEEAERQSALLLPIPDYDFIEAGLRVGKLLQDHPEMKISSRASIIKPAIDYLGGQAATQEAVASQLPGRTNGPADAYRHILWAAELTRRFGPDRARAVLELHEQDSLNRGDSRIAGDMDRHNNDIGIRLGAHAESWIDVVALARWVIDLSASDGSGRPKFRTNDSRTEPYAQWLPESQWAKNPEDANHVEMPNDRTNWVTNPKRPRGPDWETGYVPTGYQYRYGAAVPVAPNEAKLLETIGLYRFVVEHPWLSELAEGVGNILPK